MTKPYTPAHHSLDMLQSDALASLGIVVVVGAIQFFGMKSGLGQLAAISPDLPLIFLTVVLVNTVTLVLALSRSSLAAVFLSTSIAAGVSSSFLKPAYLAPAVNLLACGGFHFYLFVWAPYRQRQRLQLWKSQLETGQFSEFLSSVRWHEIDSHDAIIEGLFQPGSSQFNSSALSEFPALFALLVMLDKRCELDPTQLNTRLTEVDPDQLGQQILDTQRPLHELEVLFAFKEFKSLPAATQVAIIADGDLSSLPQELQELIFRSAMSVVGETESELLRHLASSIVSKISTDIVSAHSADVITTFNTAQLDLVIEHLGPWILSLIERHKSEFDFHEPETHWTLCGVFAACDKQIDSTTEATITPVWSDDHQEQLRLLKTELAAKAIGEIRANHPPGDNVIADDIIEEWESLQTTNVSGETSESSEAGSSE